ncbi:MAG TPA: acireductone synthase, partial [Pyrinomonadaceae bacterium]|nr:acireductone synthase [Pyrinomonadaceae bacterium]
ELVSDIFDDVPAAFDAWHAAGKTIAIYSSGSVLAQQLLFRYTTHGDLTPAISNNFDTEIGAKRDTESYRRIAASLSLEPGDVLFVSDIPAELDAARSAGMNTALAVRPGNAAIDGDVVHEIITTFADLKL